MVQLLEWLRGWRGENPTFQFQYGAIIRTLYSWIGYVRPLFQFQYGAIISVRLIMENDPNLNFNSSMVQLLDVIDSEVELQRFHFNSSMVQLLEGWNVKGIWTACPFQFQYGAIIS